MNQRLRHGTLLLLLVLTTLLHAAEIDSTLPPSFSPDQVLLEHFQPASFRLLPAAGATASGRSTLGPIRDLLDDQYEPRLLADGTTAAEYGTANWVVAQHHRWFVGYGSGRMNRYTGNHDAGQYWVDQQTHSAQQSAYHPIAAVTELKVSWLSVGHQVPFTFGSVHGTCDVTLRRLDGDDLFLGTAVGDATGSDFSGMIKRLDANTPARHAPGEGWAADLHVLAHLTPHLDCSVAVDGLLGQITWQGVTVNDDFLVSQQVVTDADGFFQEVGGATGQTWREDVRLNVQPVTRVDLLYWHQPSYFLRIEQTPHDTIPSLGIGWPRHNWMPYLRAYPTQQAVEAGIMGRFGQLSIMTDGWGRLNPDAADVRLTLYPFRF